MLISGGHLNKIHLSFMDLTPYEPIIFKDIFFRYQNNINRLELHKRWILCRDFLMKRNVRFNILEQLYFSEEEINNIDFLNNMLTKHADLLTHLKVGAYDDHCVREACVINFPKLSQLKTLELDTIDTSLSVALLESCANTVERVFMQTIRFEANTHLPNLPQLKCLEILYSEYSTVPLMLSKYHQTIQSLNIYVCENGGLSSIKVPNLKHLKFRLCCDELMDFLKANTNNLESLMIDDGDIWRYREWPLFPKLKCLLIKEKNNDDVVMRLLSKCAETLQCLVLSHNEESARGFSDEKQILSMKLPNLTDLFLIARNLKKMKEFFTHNYNHLKFLVLHFKYVEYIANITSAFQAPFVNVHTLILFIQNGVLDEYDENLKIQRLRQRLPNAKILILYQEMVCPRVKCEIGHVLEARYNYLKLDDLFKESLEEWTWQCPELDSDSDSISDDLEFDEL